jgi:hypothetical protein
VTNVRALPPLAGRIVTYKSEALLDKAATHRPSR